jgi:hypothetical protein
MLGAPPASATGLEGDHASLRRQREVPAPFEVLVVVRYREVVHGNERRGLAAAELDTVASPGRRSPYDAGDVSGVTPIRERGQQRREGDVCLARDR